MSGVKMIRTLSRRLLEVGGSMSPLESQQKRLMFKLTNTVIKFVPQQEAWVIERFGKFKRILQPGFNILMPFADRIKYAHSLKEMVIEVPEQHAITADNVTLTIDGVLYVRITDPYKASYGVQEPEFAITQLAQTTMRSEIGKINLDSVFKERENLNLTIVDAINLAAESWGTACLRYEIRNIELPLAVKEAMQMQVEAERKKRAAVLESEGHRESEINVAEGRKQARILESEALKMEKLNLAQGDASATIAKARAKAVAVAVLAEAVSKENGMNAVSMRVAESYVDAFSNLAKTSNTVLLPTNTGDVSSMVAQAMTIYNKVSDHKAPVTKSTEKKPADKVDNKHFVEEQLEKLSDLHPDDILKEELDNIVSGKKES